MYSIQGEDPHAQDRTGITAGVRKKICLVGANGVGKTSLVRRYVDNVFSEDYTKTLGARVGKSMVATRDTDVSCVIWDVQGDEEDNAIPSGYFRGMSGYLLFVDGTRHASAISASNLITTIEATIGPVPFVLVLNKLDLKYRWNITPQEISKLSSKAYVTIECSAKTGAGVSESFEALANAMLCQSTRFMAAS